MSVIKQEETDMKFNIESIQKVLASVGEKLGKQRHLSADAPCPLRATDGRKPNQSVRE